MRIVTCVVLGLSFAATASAAAPLIGPPARAYIRPPVHAYIRPPAGVMHVGPHAPGQVRRHNGNRNYGAGYGAWGGYPGVVVDEGAGRAGVQSQVFAPRTNVWYGPPPIGQGDIGYVTQPAIYDVAHELAKRPSFLPAVRK